MDEVFWSRLLIFTVLPVAVGLGVMRWDEGATTTRRRIEALLVPLFVIGIGGAGFGGVIAHVFISDRTAEAIGWAAGSPFQLEVGFANLAIGVLGAVAASRRDGWRDATVVAVSIFSIGATLVHIVDLIDTGNTAPGNTVQNVANLARPALLIPLLMAQRRAEAAETESDDEFDSWRAPIIGASVLCVVVVSTAFGIGFAIDQPVALTLVGVAVGVTAFVAFLRSARI